MHMYIYGYNAFTRYFCDSESLDVHVIIFNADLCVSDVHAIIPYS